MTCLHSNLSAPRATITVQTQPPALVSPALQELEHLMSDTLAMLRRNLFNPGIGGAPSSDPGWPDAGEIEYASWVPNPGAIEYASWSVPARACPR